MPDVETTGDSTNEGPSGNDEIPFTKFPTVHKSQ